MKRLPLFLATIGVMLCWIVPGEAALEQRCQELGANCVCSERLESPSWTSGGQPWWDGIPVDATDKPCLVGNGRHRIIATERQPQVVTGLGGLPAWHDSSTGTYVSAVQISSVLRDGLSGRVAARYYIKLNTGYQTTGQGSCTNDKYIQLGDYFTAQFAGFYSSNGGNFPRSEDPTDYINKWIRIEMVVDRKSSPSTMRFYLKNVTDNTPEISFSRTTRLANSPSNWEATDPIHKYREGSCNGTADMMFAVMAHWPSSNGTERIGAALELEEGLTSNITPPETPTGLRLLP